MADQDEERSAIGAVEPPPARPRGLLGALLLALLVAAGIGLYARQLEQQRAQLRAQLGDQEHRILELRERLTAAEVAVQEKNAALATRDAQLAQATLPELPVRVSFRPAFMGQGMVATFQNTSSEQLSLMVEFRDDTLHGARDFVLVVPAGGKAEVGHAQGWLVNSGQSVRVSANGYRSVTAFAP